MKLSAVLLASLAASASAFAPAAKPSFSRTALFEEAEAAEEAPAEEVAEEPAAPAGPAYTCVSRDVVLSEPNTIEFGGKWDPLGLSDLGSDETIAWFRHSEVKHGRIAMAAFVGWWAVAGLGARFPGELAYGTDFASLPSKGLEAWDAVPGWGKVQMLLFAGLIEFHDELFHSRRGTHYMRGGTPGKNMVPGLYDPLGFSKGKTEEQLARGRSVEIKNGRLAMIGIAGLYAAATIPGSVPLQPDC